MQSRLFTKGLFQFEFEIAYMEFTMLFEDPNSMDVFFKTIPLSCIWSPVSAKAHHPWFRPSPSVNLWIDT